MWGFETAPGDLLRLEQLLDGSQRCAFMFERCFDTTHMQSGFLALHQDLLCLEQHLDAVSGALLCACKDMQ